MFLARSSHECVNGFDLWKRPHDQRSGGCYNNNDNNVSSPAAINGMMKSRHDASTSSLNVTHQWTCVWGNLLLSTTASNKHLIMESVH
jgi:hypothetical protein